MLKSYIGREIIDLDIIGCPSYDALKIDHDAICTCYLNHNCSMQKVFMLRNWVLKKEEAELKKEEAELKKKKDEERHDDEHDEIIFEDGEEQVGGVREGWGVEEEDEGED